MFSQVIVAPHRSQGVIFARNKGKHAHLKMGFVERLSTRPFSADNFRRTLCLSNQRLISVLDWPSSTV